MAPRDSKPGAVMVETTAMSRKSLAINSEKRKVTLLDADGKKKTVRVKSGVDLSRPAVGDSVDALSRLSNGGDGTRLSSIPESLSRNRKEALTLPCETGR